MVEVMTPEWLVMAMTMLMMLHRYGLVQQQVEHSLNSLDLKDPKQIKAFRPLEPQPIRLH
jgi:hypothetical protein